MSVFSKLFSGSSKGETEGTSTKTGEEGPSMQRPPDDGRGAGPTPQSNPQAPKGASPIAKSTQQRSPVGLTSSSKANGVVAKPISAAVKPPAAVPPPIPLPTVIVTQPPEAATKTSEAKSRAAAAIANGQAGVQVAAPAKAATPSAVQGRGSVRPTAPEMIAVPANKSQPSIADTFERLLSAEDLDAGFASIERPTASKGGPGVAITDLAEVRTLFAQLAANHVRQVRDFVIDLRWSESTTDWVPVCEPALRSLRRAADKLELNDLCEALDRFAAALTEVLTSGTKTIAGKSRDAVLARYDDLGRLMPQAFALDLDRTQREAAILQSLLLQVPEVKKVTLDRMYAAGLTTLEAMFLANSGDIAATTGIPEALAAQIVARFRAYREQVKATVPDASRTCERELIAGLTARLRRENDEYERAAASWSRQAGDQKKELRKVREQTLLDIQVVLARLGEVVRLAELERLPFEKKLAHLEAFLEEARDKYVAQP